MECYFGSALCLLQVCGVGIGLSYSLDLGRWDTTVNVNKASTSGSYVLCAICLLVVKGPD